MRFDDSLTTVLAADTASAFGAQAAFRQVVDLVARRRIDLTDALRERLEALRGQTPSAVRAATARALALTDPPYALVAFFAHDEADVAAAVLRSARLDDADWQALLPSLGPVGRAVLRRRQDLSAATRRALDSFGSTDFSLGYAGTRDPVDARQPAAPAAEPRLGFAISSLVDRLAAYRRDTDRTRPPPPAPAPDPVRASADVPPIALGFAFETDALGAIRWIDAQPRAAVIGLSIARMTDLRDQPVDGVASGAFRRRTAFADARLRIAGATPLSGDWQISGMPVFDPVSGRFTGFRGDARRPRPDERAEPGAVGADGLRRLVHELRTPAGAIAGFSELIERELMGPVAEPYRRRAATIRQQAGDLVGAIEDLEMAARIEGDALDLRDDRLPVAALLDRTLSDLSALIEMRGCTIDAGTVPDELAFACDDRAGERLVGRLLAAVVASAAADEVVAIRIGAAGSRATLQITRPGALAEASERGLLTLDAEREADLPGAPLLGTGFALRLARNLAGQLGGSLTIDARHLTLALPVATNEALGRSAAY